MATSNPGGLNVPPPPSAAPAAAARKYGLPAGTGMFTEGGVGKGTGPGGRYERPESSVPVPFGQGGGGYSEADLKEFAYMPAEEIARLQREMQRAGLIKGSYQYGQFDSAMAAGLETLFNMANQKGQDYRQVLGELSAEGGVTNERKRQAEAAKAAASASYETQLHQYQRTDPALIRITAERAFREALGRKPKPAELAKFVKHWQDTEFNTQRTAYSMEDANFANKLSRQGVAGEATVDQFMQALAGQESGGDPNATNARTGASGTFQIMPGNWSAWAKEAGLSANAPKTPQNQQIVARHKLQAYKDQFGSWDAVAVAWYAGPGAVAGYLRNPDDPRYTRNQGHGNEPSIRQYVQDIGARLGEAGLPQTGQTGSGEADLNARVQALMAAAPGKVTVGSGKRTRAEQEVLYARYKAGKGPTAAKPGTSKHETGEANDLHYENAATREWVLQHAGDFGLVLPVKGENWHVEVAHGQTARFGPQAGKKVGSATTMPYTGGGPGVASTMPYSGNGTIQGTTMSTPGVAGGPPISQSFSTTNADLGAQATEYARNVNPVETQAYDIGGQFQNLMALIQKGVA